MFDSWYLIFTTSTYLQVAWFGVGWLCLIYVKRQSHAGGDQEEAKEEHLVAFWDQEREIWICSLFELVDVLEVVSGVQVYKGEGGSLVFPLLPGESGCPSGLDFGSAALPLDFGLDVAPNSTGFSPSPTSTDTGGIIKLLELQFANLIYILRVWTTINFGQRRGGQGGCI